MFSSGDVVALRSGGIHMTVVTSDSSQTVVSYYNPTTGLITTETIDTRCLRAGGTQPQNPQGVSR